MINIKNMGTLKNLTRVMSNQGYDLVKMIYDGEFNELTIKYDNENSTDRKSVV